MNDWVYDCEVYPNVFTIAFEHAEAPIRVAFEISDWRNDSVQLMDFLNYLHGKFARMIGFNNVGFDFPILHMFIKMGGRADAKTLYDKCQAIITSQNDRDGDGRFAHRVKPSDCFIPQIDLYLISHFDNAARATSLKVLEFNMRSDSIEDLPFPVGTTLTREQIEVLKRYNAHDVSQTKKFYHHSKEMIAFREELTEKYQRDFINHNDTKIGKDFVIMELERAGISCYDYSPGKGRQPRQTRRPVIHLRDAVPPWVAFQQPEFNRVLDWLKGQSVTETKGVFKDLTAKVGGLTFVFGLGGIHGSVENETVEARDDLIIESVDVSSMYPNIAIKNRFYPEHLGTTFCDIYEQMYEQRKKYAKGSAENAMLKLALNGTFGDSNNQFSVFYDPLMTLRITLTGQLTLCMLAERLMTVPTVRIIMANTDGLEYTIHPAHVPQANWICKEWEMLTQLTLERARYKKMWISNVNNYVAEYVSGSVKRKGAYEYNLGWHQNASALVVPKVAEKVLVEGAPIRQTIEAWPDLMDFMLRTKVPRSSHLLWGDEKVQNVTRYLVTKDGKPLTKVMPPLKGKEEWRRIGIESGWNVTVCNRIEDAQGARINFDYYIQECEKLVLGLK